MQTDGDDDDDENQYTPARVSQPVQFAAIDATIVVRTLFFLGGGGCGKRQTKSKKKKKRKKKEKRRLFPGNRYVLNKSEKG